MAAFDVIVAGDYCLDLVFTGLPGFPELGREVVGSGFAMVPGASYNNAVTLHRLGLRVGWAGDFGNDEFSRWTLEQARAEGLDTSLCVVHNRPMRRVTVAVSYPEERAFIAFYDPEPAVPAAMKALAANTAKLLYIPGVYTGPAFGAGMALVRAKRMKVAMDGHMAEDLTLADGSVKRALQQADVFLPNAAEARRLTGEEDLAAAIQRLAQAAKLVVIKDGANGAYSHEGKRVVHEPGLELQAVDTTGAGDAFNSGFLAAWLQGAAVRECLRWGNTAGGLSTLAAGGTARRVTMADMAERRLAG